MADNDEGARYAVAIGASAGGLPALRTVVGDFPFDLPAVVLVVLHLSPASPSILSRLLAAWTPMTVRVAREGLRVRPGCVYVAVPDRHLLVRDGRIALTASALVHHARPSVDSLFESVAGGWSKRAVGVILSGNGVDGAAGISAIKRAGGRTIAQDPADCEFPGMPRAAVATGLVEMVVPLHEVGNAVTRAVRSMAAPATLG